LRALNDFALSATAGSRTLSFFSGTAALPAGMRLSIGRYCDRMLSESRAFQAKSMVGFYDMAKIA
jgi:hypothetical protein